MKSFLIFFLAFHSYFNGFSQTSNEALKLNRTRISFILGSGSGFKKLDMGVTDKGDKITLSPGGGFHFGGCIGYLISRNLEFSTDLLYHKSEMMPKVNNGSATFSRFNVTPTFKYIFNFSEQYKLNLGLGINVATSPEMEVDASKMPNGAHNVFTFESGIGPKLGAEFEIYFNKMFSGVFGIKYYSLAYKFGSMTSNGVVVPKEYISSTMLNELNDLDGSGLDFSFGIALHL